MKLVSFNIWGGTVYEPLMDYLKNLSANTDIFCFQEVFSSLPGAPKESGGGRMFLFDELKELLPDFVGFYDPRSINNDFDGKVDFPVSHGLAVFVRKTLSVADYRSEILEQSESKEDPVEGWVKAQALIIAQEGKEFAVINFHGAAHPGDKSDTPQRLEHSRRLRLIWDSLGEQVPKILCGDFNMMPETESIKMLDAKGKNLIKEFKIQNTRNEISWRKYPGSKQTFADYTFVSSEIKVNNFEVPYNEVSDHLPMLLDFSL